MSDIENFKDQQDQINALEMHLNWDDDCKMFVLSYVEGNRAIFQVKMSPPAFEKMTSDMVRTVKNYNLHQAINYKSNQEMENAQEKI